MHQSETVKKYTFSGHETFQCRQLWLKKGYDFVKSKSSFNDEDAVVKLGVGKNMVASIRYWLKAFNIIDTKDVLTPFAIKLLDDDGWDPFLEDDASLWLLHYQLINTNLASTYNIIFNEFRREKIYFNKDTFINYLKRKEEAEKSLTISEKTINDDFNIFVKMYLSSGTTAKEVEDSFSGILSDLNLLKSFIENKNDKKVEQFQIENSERDSLPEAVLLYAILDNKNYGDSISINTLEQDFNSPGVIFALNRSGLINKVSEIANENKNIVFTDHAGIKELQFKKKPDINSILDSYYGQ